MLDTSGLSTTEFENLDVEFDDLAEEKWRDVFFDAYVDTILAENEDEACKLVGNIHQYDFRCLVATQVYPQ